MANKLKNLSVTKVDFVDEGANPDAHIRLFKRKGLAEGVKKTYQQAGTEPKGGSRIWKRFFHSIAKAVGMEDSDIRHLIDDVEKGNSFDDEMNARKNREIIDEIWDLCIALHSALCSILNDGELDVVQAKDAMQESIDQFCDVMAGSAQEWVSGSVAGIIRKNVGKITPAELEVMKAARDRLSAEIKKASGQPEQIVKPEKGESEEMKINKSKLTPEELAFLEDIEKRCGEEETNVSTSGTGEGGAEVSIGSGAEQNVGKSIHQGNIVPAAQDVSIPEVQVPQAAGDDSNIYKGLHPAVQAELEELKKFRENAENKELADIAKKYAIIGKKEEELIPMFKSLKAAGGTAYNDMIAVLDQAVEAVEKSGIFGEIGKSGGNSSGNGAEAKISDIAKGYISEDPTLSYDEAVAKAWENNPDILAEYEKLAGF